MFSATPCGGLVGRLARKADANAQRITDSHTETHAQIEQRLHWADSQSTSIALLE